MHNIQIGHCTVGPTYPPVLIAEMSGNHNQSLERALALVDAAADAGADGLKLQTYTPDTMTLDLREGDFWISDPNSLWKGRSLYDLYGEAYTPWEWHKPIKERCEQRGMFFLSTPFDSTSVDFLEELGVACYKIASFECVDIPLIKKVARTGKPLIISTGMASLSEIDEAVQAARSEGARDIILLKCTSSYPATPENTNIRTISHLRDAFHVQVGLSDHTMGVGVSSAAVALGATIIEKHFTLRRADGGVDSSFSLEPAELAVLAQELKRAWQALGVVAYGGTKSEEKSRIFRRSIYVCKDIGEGEVFSEENVRCIRPGGGLPPKYYELILGKRSSRAIKKGAPLTWIDFG